ncbi:MAG: DUF992 domain-containing protein [Beijerinckiaceae bacterium]
MTLAVVAGSIAITDNALAQSRVNIGNLSCTVDGGVGLILGSRRNVTCRFTPVGATRASIYRGDVSRLGVDIGVTNRSFIRWLVFAPGSVKPGALAGNYSGVSAQASAGLGLGANVLVGGLRDSIALQPVSVQGQTGLNLAVGISRLRLRPAR